MASNGGKIPAITASASAVTALSATTVTNAVDAPGRPFRGSITWLKSWPPTSNPTTDRMPGRAQARCAAASAMHPFAIACKLKCEQSPIFAMCLLSTRYGNSLI